MNFFNRGKAYGGRERSDNRSDNRGDGRRGDNRRDNREDRQMHRAICDECGRSCEVPFRPSGDKPVYCSDCFGKGNSAPAPRKSFQPSAPREMPVRSDKKQDEILAKLDRIITLLEKQHKDVPTPKVKTELKVEAPVEKVQKKVKKATNEKKVEKATPAKKKAKK